MHFWRFFFFLFPVFFVNHLIILFHVHRHRVLNVYKNFCLFILLSKKCPAYGFEPEWLLFYGLFWISPKFTKTSIDFNLHKVKNWIWTLVQIIFRLVSWHVVYNHAEIIGDDYILCVISSLKSRFSLWWIVIMSFLSLSRSLLFRFVFNTFRVRMLNFPYYSATSVQYAVFF